MSPGGTSLLVPCGAHSVSLSLFLAAQGSSLEAGTGRRGGCPGGPGRSRKLLGPRLMLCWLQGSAGAWAPPASPSSARQASWCGETEAGAAAGVPGLRVNYDKREVLLGPKDGAFCLMTNKDREGETLTDLLM